MDTRRLSSTDKASGELIDVLAQSAFTIMGALTKLAADSGLSLTQLRAIAILRDRTLRMSELGDYLGLEKSTLTGLITRAETRGLLLRTPNAADKRAVDVQLTHQGLKFAEQLAGELNKRMRTFITPLDDDERRALIRLMSKVVGV